MQLSGAVVPVSLQRTFTLKSSKKDIYIRCFMEGLLRSSGGFHKSFKVIESQLRP